MEGPGPFYLQPPLPLILNSPTVLGPTLNLHPELAPRPHSSAFTSFLNPQPQSLSLNLNPSLTDELTPSGSSTLNPSPVLHPCRPLNPQPQPHSPLQVP